MSLFAPPILMTLTPAEIDVLSRPIEATREGGHQRLLHDILDGWDHSDRLVIEDHDLQRALAYAYDYGTGGYQGRFRTLISAARRSGWIEP
jgi:hypothetical protein